METAMHAKVRGDPVRPIRLATRSTATECLILLRSAPTSVRIGSMRPLAKPQQVCGVSLMVDGRTR